MVKWIDKVMWWSPAGSGLKAKCHVQIFRNMQALDTESWVVIMTEPVDNPGRSVTNGVEELATLLRQEYNLEIPHTKWVEHYERDGFDLETGEPSEDSFDWVGLTWDGLRARNATWTFGNWEQVADLIGAGESVWSELKGESLQCKELSNALV